MIPNNACTLRITAAAGTELAGAFSVGTVKFPFVPTKRALRPEGLHHSRGIAGSGFPPLSNIPNCCLPWESGPCSSSSVADHPLRPATHQSLGEPLPHQLANRPGAAPFTAYAFTGKSRSFPGSFGISQAFAWLSPVNGYITQVLLTRAPLYSYCYFLVRLACLRHAASVHSEPGSNSQIKKICYYSALRRTALSVT